MARLAGGECAALLAPLARRVAAGELAALAAQPEALRLVLPTAIAVLEQSASCEGADVEMGRQYLQVREPPASAVQPRLLRPSIAEVNPCMHWCFLFVIPQRLQLGVKLLGL